MSRRHCSIWYPPTSSIGRGLCRNCGGAKYRVRVRISGIYFVTCGNCGGTGLAGKCIARHALLSQHLRQTQNNHA